MAHCGSLAHGYLAACPSVLSSAPAGLVQQVLAGLGLWSSCPVVDTCNVHAMVLSCALARVSWALHMFAWINERVVCTLLLQQLCLCCVVDDSLPVVKEAMERLD